MKDQIQIVNWLLTRKCNLNCSYCGIVSDYEDMPDAYPHMKHYYKNEMSLKDIIGYLDVLKNHNPNIFMIFYGGEPLLRQDLPDIVNYCNDNDIYYTIITNNSKEVQPLMDNLLKSVDKVTGLTSSIDPIYDEDDGDDKVKKSLMALKMFEKYKDKIDDLVAEITVTSDNLKHLHRLVSKLTDMGVSSSISFVDIVKNPYYDFSNIRDESILVNRSPDLIKQFDMIFRDNLNVHMGKDLMDEIYNILPSNYNCDLEDNLHNITIDSNGTLRTCLRIRGVDCPGTTPISLFHTGGIERFKQAIKNDKTNYCKKCNWTCPMMSSSASKSLEKSNDLIHSEKRK